MARASRAPAMIRPMPRNSCSRPSTAPRSSAVAWARLPVPVVGVVAGVLAGVFAVELVVPRLGVLRLDGRAVEPLGRLKRWDLRLDGPHVATSSRYQRGVDYPWHPLIRGFPSIGG